MSVLDVRRADHVGILVAKLEPVLRWYVDVLGSVVVDRWEDESVGMAWAHIDLAGLRIEIVQAPGRTAPDEDARGMHHVAIEVADCAAAVEVLVTAGGRAVLGPSRFDRYDMDWAFVRDPFGTVIEVLSYRSGAPSGPPAGAR